MIIMAGTEYAGLGSGSLTVQLNTRDSLSKNVRHHMEASRPAAIPNSIFVYGVLCVWSAMSGTAYTDNTAGG
jgi:hypothetical protein